MGRDCLEDVEDDGGPRDLADALEQHKKRIARQTLDPLEEKRVEQMFCDVQRHREDERQRLALRIQARVDRLVDHVQGGLAARDG